MEVFASHSQKSIFFWACGLRKRLILFHVVMHQRNRGAIVDLLVTPVSSEITRRVETQPTSYQIACEQPAGVVC